MRRLFFATVIMQKVERNRVDTKPVMSLLWGTDLSEVEKDAAFSASATCPDMKVVQSQAVQVPDDVIREAAAELA